MRSKEHYVWKAKHQRGLNDEQIAYFLQRDGRWELLPYYSRFVRKFGTVGAWDEVVRMFGLPERVLDPVAGVYMTPGSPETCECCSFTHPELDGCNECDWYLDCYRDELEDRYPDLYEDKFDAELREVLAPLQAELEKQIPDQWPEIEAEIRRREDAANSDGSEG